MARDPSKLITDARGKVIGYIVEYKDGVCIVTHQPTGMVLRMAYDGPRKDAAGNGHPAYYALLRQMQTDLKSLIAGEPRDL